MKKDASRLDRKTKRHRGYEIGLSRRWLVEMGFGSPKQTGSIHQVKLRDLHTVDRIDTLSCAAHNLMLLPRLIAYQAEHGLQHKCACTQVEWSQNPQPPPQNIARNHPISTKPTEMNPF